MAKPKIKIDIENRISKDEVYKVLKEILNDVSLNGITYSREEIDDLINTHNHDDLYVTREQLQMISNNDWGGLFDDIEEDPTGGDIV